MIGGDTMEFDPNIITSYRITNTDTIYNCIHGGKGQLVLSSPSGKSHKYIFSSPRNAHEFEPGTIFVYVNHENYKYYLGMLSANGIFKLTRNSRFEPDSEAVKGVYYIMKMVNNQELVDKTSMKLYHLCRCSKCGRPIQSEKWLEIGIGKRCMRKYLKAQESAQWNGN